MFQLDLQYKVVIDPAGSRAMILDVRASFRYLHLNCTSCWSNIHVVKFSFCHTCTLELIIFNLKEFWYHRVGRLCM